MTEFSNYLDEVADLMAVESYYRFEEYLRTHKTINDILEERAAEEDA